eukprot:3730253-Prorocentrum_lima.AAC.1
MWPIHDHIPSDSGMNHCEVVLSRLQVQRLLDIYVPIDGIDRPFSRRLPGLVIEALRAAVARWA